MINKAIIFDLDGVLVDSKEIHFNALNLALSDYDKRYIITQEEQEKFYEGLTTRSKLDILNKTKGLPEEAYQSIWENKQLYTSKLFQSIGTDVALIMMLSAIKDRGFKIGVASNSIRDTLDTCLSNLGLLGIVDISLSNEDVTNPKPNPEIYTKTMSLLGSIPETTVIYEDSEIGQAAAIASGAFLIPVYNRNSLDYRLIQKGVEYFAKH